MVNYNCDHRLAQTVEFDDSIHVLSLTSTNKNARALNTGVRRNCRGYPTHTCGSWEEGCTHFRSADASRPARINNKFSASTWPNRNVADLPNSQNGRRWIYDCINFSEARLHRSTPTKFIESKAPQSTLQSLFKANVSHSLLHTLDNFCGDHL